MKVFLLLCECPPPLFVRIAFHPNGSKGFADDDGDPIKFTFFRVLN